MYNIYNTHESFIDSHVYTSYTSTYMHGKKNQGKRGTEFDKEQRGVYGRTWREAREGGSDVITISKKK